MLLLNHNLTEDYSIAEELMQTDDLIRKCKVVQMAVRDGDFTLEEALKIYKVSKADYINFTANNLSSLANDSFSSEPLRQRTEDALHLLEIIYVQLVGRYDPHLGKRRRYFKKISKEIEFDTAGKIQSED